MKSLEEKILNFDNWTKPWTFRDFILSDGTLTNEEVNIFNEIWKKAGDPELWNNDNLALCCKASEEFIAKYCNLSDKAISNIVRSLSYEWQ